MKKEKIQKIYEDTILKNKLLENKLGDTIKSFMNDAAINLIVTGIWKVMDKSDKNWRKFLSDEEIMAAFDKEFSKMKISSPLVAKLKKRAMLKMSGK